MARQINFSLNDLILSVDFGTYALMLYYAKEIDAAKAKLLYNATSTEYYYRIENDLPVGDLDLDDENAHFNVVELQQLLSFIDHDIFLI